MQAPSRGGGGGGGCGRKEGSVDGGREGAAEMC